MEYENNVAWTRHMAAKAHEAGAAVEAELGKLAGEEDGLSVPEVEAKMTDPEQVRWYSLSAVSAQSVLFILYSSIFFVTGGFLRIGRVCLDTS